MLRSPQDRQLQTARLPYIDVCRGLLFLLMTSSHTVSLIGLSADHWIRRYGLPRGWSTSGFVSLSGFAIGVIMFPKFANPRTRARLIERGWQILVVMFVSNALMLVGEHLLSGNGDVLQRPSWWIGLVTLQTPYSISSVLIPTAGLLFIAPVILQSIQRYSAYRVLIVLTIASCCVTVAIRQIASPETLHYLVRLLLFGQDNFCNVLPLILMGAICVTLGVLWLEHDVRLSVIAVPVFFLLSSTRGYSAVPSILLQALFGPLVLLDLLLVAVVLSYGPRLQWDE